MHDLKKVTSSIKNYRPLDVAGDAIWIPIPKSCGEVFGISYDVEAALKKWGVMQVMRASGEPVLHPNDESVGKFTLPNGWIAGHYQGPEWTIRDENDYERIRIRYEPGEFDYIVMSWLSIPFDVQTRISKDEVPPKEWWLELSHHYKVVFKSESVHPFTDDVLQARAELSEVEFSTRVFLPRLDTLKAPLTEAAKAHLAREYPLFPADPSAYW